jgi:KDO2-lipid IV(A) lauroyltransferase
MISEKIAAAIAFLFYVFRARIRRNVRRNFQALDVPDPRIFEVFRNFSRATLDFLRMSSSPEADPRRTCLINGREHLDKALAEGRGAILFSPHTGPWEIAGACLASMGYSIHTVALEHPSKRVTEFFSRRRSSWGIADYPLHESAAKLLQALRNGDVVVLLVDRNFVGRGLELDFLGSTVLLPDGHIILALRTGCALLPSSCFYTEEGAIEGIIEEPVEFSRDDTPAEEIGRACLKRIEKHIRAHPAQWFAFDHFWPEG